MNSDRRERDSLGERAVPAGVYWGIHTLRARENFPLSGYRVDPMLIRAYGYVKKACGLVNQDLGAIPADRAGWILAACDELISGRLDEWVVVDALSGGAGTSLNMNINEVLANRALVLGGRAHGDYVFISPLDHINRYQSTNDTFPTALKVAALFYLHELEEGLTGLQQVLLRKEEAFRSVVKIGRTEWQEAVPMTLGAEFSGYAETASNDRWRVFKARERLRMINLGGTAVGTGLGAPRRYIFAVTETLRELTGLNLCRAENLVYSTQSLDSISEAAGITSTCAANLMKLARDIRYLAALRELILPAQQAGSSIMPGKVNPVTCEAVIQAGMRCLANDGVIHQAAGLGTLEINEYLPLVAFSLLESLRLLTRAVGMLGAFLEGVQADAAVCLGHLNASPMLMTSFVPFLGYDRVQDLHRRYQAEAAAAGRTVREFLNHELGEATVAEVLSAENLTRLGFDAPPPSPEDCHE